MSNSNRVKARLYYDELNTMSNPDGGAAWVPSNRLIPVLGQTHTIERVTIENTETIAAIKDSKLTYFHSEKLLEDGTIDRWDSGVPIKAVYLITEI